MGAMFRASLRIVRGQPRVMLVLLATLLMFTAAACKKPKGPTCKGDVDCTDGKICRDGVCQMCKSNDDCGDGKTCEAGACTAVSCKTDTDCTTGSCIDGTCQMCDADADCGAGGACKSGLCVRSKACTSDDQCADDEDCVERRCQKAWSPAAAVAGSCELSTVFFAYDDDAIATTERDKLGVNAQCLETSVGKQIYLFGHTDDSGTDEYNIALSERRAAAVADYLSRLGIDPTRMQVVPKGETQASGAGADKDRRVEFTWK